MANSRFYVIFIAQLQPLYSIASIVGILSAEGRETIRTMVRKWIFRWEKQSGLEDKTQCGRLSKITRENADYLNQQLEEDDELSSVELQHLVAWKFAVELSLPLALNLMTTSASTVISASCPITCFTFMRLAARIV